MVPMLTKKPRSIPFFLCFALFFNAPMMFAGSNQDGLTQEQRNFLYSTKTSKRELAPIESVKKKPQPTQVPKNKTNQAKEDSQADRLKRIWRIEMMMGFGEVVKKKEGGYRLVLTYFRGGNRQTMHYRWKDSIVARQLFTNQPVFYLSANQIESYFTAVFPTSWLEKAKINAQLQFNGQVPQDVTLSNFSLVEFKKRKKSYQKIVFDIKRTGNKTMNPIRSSQVQISFLVDAMRICHASEKVVLSDPWTLSWWRSSCKPLIQGESAG